MFCPFCGVKNEDGQAQCFVCTKTLPSLNGTTTPSRPRPALRPTQSNGGAVAARLGDRLIAIILDSIFIIAVVLVACAAVRSRWPKIAEGFSVMALGGIAAAAVVLLVFVYHWLLEGAFGATMGKAIVGVRVTRYDTGTVPGLGSSAIRNALRLIDSLPFYLVGFFVAAFSRARRRIGDYAAHTIVLEQAVSLGERITVVLLWLVGIGVALWGTWAMCPEWFRLPLP